MGRVKELKVNKRYDFYQQKAREHGYRARSAWKLKQMDDKYSFISGAKNILELGGAPGGWSQVLKERTAKAHIISCDIVKIHPIDGVDIVFGDFLKQSTIDKIKELVVLNSNAKFSFDLVLSDMSPNISGNRLRDQALMLQLAKAVLKFTEEYINSDKGVLLIKMFQGSELTDYLGLLQKHHYKVRIVKPAASKSNSSEIYLLGKKYKV